MAMYEIGILFPCFQKHFYVIHEMYKMLEYLTFSSHLPCMILDWNT